MWGEDPHRAAGIHADSLLNRALGVWRGLGLGSCPGALRSCLRKQLRIREGERPCPAGKRCGRGWPYRCET